MCKPVSSLGCSLNYMQRTKKYKTYQEQFEQVANILYNVFILLFVHHVVDAQKRDLGLATWFMGSSAIIEFPFARLLEIDPLCFYGNFQISYIA